MKYKVTENKWVRNNSNWNLQWTNEKIIDKDKLTNILNLFNKITCDKIIKDNNYIIINNKNKFEIIIKEEF